MAIASAWSASSVPRGDGVQCPHKWVGLCPPNLASRERQGQEGRLSGTRLLAAWCLDPGWTVEKSSRPRRPGACCKDCERRLEELRAAKNAQEVKPPPPPSDTPGVARLQQMVLDFAMAVAASRQSRGFTNQCSSRTRKRMTTCR